MLKIKHLQMSVSFVIIVVIITSMDVVVFTWSAAPKKLDFALDEHEIIAKTVE